MKLFSLIFLTFMAIGLAAHRLYVSHAVQVEVLSR